MADFHDTCHSQQTFRSESGLICQSWFESQITFRWGETLRRRFALSEHSLVKKPNSEETRDVSVGMINLVPFSVRCTIFVPAVW